jgi:glycosyltransferase involved in cell wall biosynthesis
MARSMPREPQDHVGPLKTERVHQKVSVVIPCYNQADLLPDAIESVLAQTIRHHEIVVVDDGSPDDPSLVASRFAGYGVRCLRQANAGLACARNAGFRASTGDFLVFLDADDRLLPCHFEASLHAFREHPHAGLVCGDFQILGDEEVWHHAHRCAPLPDHYGTLLRFNFIGPPHPIMFRHEAVASVGGFRSEFKGSEDYDLLLRIARRYPIYCHHQVVAEYRRYSSQMSRKWDLMFDTQMAALQGQWKWIRGQPVYEEAYREGIQRCRHHYGERALWQMVQLARSGEYAAALRHFKVLAHRYPKGLLRLAAGKAWRLLARTAPMSSEARRNPSGPGPSSAD